MESAGVEEVIRAAAKIVVEAALKLIQNDPHSWSTRPCQTCQAVSSITGVSFGCVAYRIKKETA